MKIPNGMIVPALVAIATLFAFSIRAQVPRTISYQGLLATSGAGSANGQHLITIALYDSLTGGVQLFNESHELTVTNGIFNIEIGSESPIPTSLTFDQPYYLGASIDGGAELSPRSKLDAVPYALHASIADIAAGMAPDATGVVTSINEFAGPLRLGGDSTLTVTENGQQISLHANFLGVQSLNGETGSIKLIAGTGTTITPGNGTITITATGGGGGTGIQGISNSDGSIAIINPSGPTATIGLAGIASATNGEILTANGNGGAGWQTNNKLTSVTANLPIIGSGTAASPLKITNGSANGQVLTWNGSAWAAASPGSGGTGWGLLGNTGTTFGTNFLGTIDSVDLQFRAHNVQVGLIQVGVENFNYSSANTAFGFGALRDNAAGFYNVAIGYSALDSNTTGYMNTATGANALLSNTTGGQNTATGADALFANTTGNANTADGLGALGDNSTGSSNTAIGDLALNRNSTGNGNTASGFYTLDYNASGNNNTASGNEALYASVTGNNNTADGASALYSNTAGSSNTAEGFEALWVNSLGNNNTALGDSALVANTTGSNNTALGYRANVSGNALTNATAVGANAVVGQSNAVVLGSGANVGIGTSTPRTSLDVVGTDAIIVPVGTTAQRPATPVQGMIRFNTTTTKFEGYDGSAWQNLN